VSTSSKSPPGPATIPCPHCGTPVSHASKCERCGTSFETPDSTTVTTFIDTVTVDAVTAPSSPASEASATTAEDLGAPSTGKTRPSSTIPDFGPRYRVECLLGEGGMGTVYKAWDRELDRPVALKLIRRDLTRDPNVARRFKQELLLASKISHRNVLRIHDLGDGPGDTKFISMACVDGRDLHYLLKKEGKLPLERALNIARQLCAALEAAHGEGVVHRDLKPQNILIDQHDHIYVSDFGLAKSLESELSMTQTGQFLGTPRYMSPEQAEIRPVDHRSDLYAVGLILCEMLTGSLPFEHSQSAMQMLYQRVHQTPKDVRELNHDLPASVAHIIEKCLERDVNLRYQTAGELQADLNHWGNPNSTTAGNARTRLKRILSHTQMPWRMTAIVAIAIALLTIFGLLRTRQRTSRPHEPISVLVADFTNHTGDPVFDGTLEPLFNVALEGASFVNAFDRGDARRLAVQLPKPTDKLDEQSSRVIAMSQGISTVVTGSLSRRGDGYKISVEALDARTGNSLATADVMAANQNEVLQAIPKLAVPVRKALGDTTPQTAQFNTISGGFTASSVEVVHLEAVAMRQQFAGKFEDALRSFSKAAELDPNFARAYSGMAATAMNMGKQQDAVRYIKLAMEHEDRMTERERYRNRGLFYLATGNWQKCVDENTQLVSRYPAERTGMTNLASCLAEMRKLAEAVTAAAKVVSIAPNDVLYRLNLSFLASASGDFQYGEKEARAALQLNPSSEIAYLMLGEAQLAQGQMTQAADTYDRLEKLGENGASTAAIALADLAVYEGRFQQAVTILQRTVTADLAANRAEAAANKFAALAYVQLLRNKLPSAQDAAHKALAQSEAVSIRFLAARIFIEGGDLPRAQKLASSLASELQAEPQAYAKIVRAKLALRNKDAAGAITLFTDANVTFDTWVGHFELGRAYLQLGAFVEADSEFDRCLKRRGEALELFMDDVPTYGYFPSVYYYQGRVREGLRSPEAASSYRAYLNIREKAGEDLLLAEVRRRAGN
jgi:serine/threonine protein kinase/tetratricopeptide (TPR) repeat protein